MNTDTWLPRLIAKLRDAKHQAERKQVRSVLEGMSRSLLI